MCVSPIIIRNPHWNKVLFKSDRQYLAVPCGKCPECLNARRNQWSYRLNVEARYYPEYMLPFVTLTYSDDALVYDEDYKPTLVKKHFQQFIKAIRNDNPGLSFKFYGIGEHGETFERPHYHILFFGVPNYLNFQKYWKYGHVDVGDVEPGSIHYVAGYFLLNNRSEHSVKPFSLMSKNIGLQHYIDYKLDYLNYVRNNIAVSVGTYRTAVPRYFKNLLKKEFSLPSFDSQFTPHLVGDTFYLIENYYNKHKKQPKFSYGYQNF